MSGFVSEWLEKPRSATMDRRVVEAIARRRRQMLLHCYLYYGIDETIIDDRTWTKWAKQLAALQAKYGRIIKFYDRLFKDWNGSSGFHLVTNKGVDHNVVRVAQRVLAQNKGGIDILEGRNAGAECDAMMAHYRTKWASEKYEI